MKAFLRDWIPVFLWMGFIFYLSNFPGDQLPSVPVPQIDKAVHFVEYAILGALLLRAVSNSKFGARPVKALFFAWMIASAFAVSDEWHQSFVAGRSSEWLEVGLDVIFSLAGMALYYYPHVRHVRRRLS